MTRYLTFSVNNEKVGIKYSIDYLLEETHINKVFTGNEGEYIHYKGNIIQVYDSGTILQNKPLKKFDGLLFITKNNKTIAFKIEGFCREGSKVQKEINPLSYL